MLPLVRLEKIADLVRQKGNLSIEELSSTLGVSGSSIRRDLTKLAAKNEIRRTHGGAVAIKELSPPLSFEEKQEINIADKKRIAEKAAGLVNKGETICLDGGTTTQFIAEDITKLSSLTVVTNSISTLSYLSRFPHIKLISIGGMVKHDIQGIVGNLTDAILEKINIDKLFLGADGISPQRGIFTSSEMEGFTKTKMIAAAKEVILVADSHKIGQSGLIKFASWEDITLFITDRNAKKYISEFKKIKTKVIMI